MQYIGLFFSRQPDALLGALDAPYAVLGRHALCARGAATDGGAMAVVTGWIRNERALGEEIRRAGVRIDPLGGQAALALAAYRLWGASYPSRLEGPVASVVIDQDAGRLVLSRDRIGEQPVYYIARGGSVAFADAPALLLSAPIARRAVEREGLQELFALGPARTPGLTPIAGLKALEPGTTLIADGRGHRIKRYFSLQARPHEDDAQTTLVRVRELIEQALADVMWMNPASMLSGGLDSTVLSALAARSGSGALRTWSVGYVDDDKHYAHNDYQHERDTPYIEAAATLLNAKHHNVLLTHDALFDGLHDAMMARGLPGMADVDASLMLFARQIAREESFVLSGECADEVFGGYPWFHREALIERDGFPWSGSLMLRESVLKPSVRERLKLPEYAAARYHESAARQPRFPGDSVEDERLRLIHGLCLDWFMPVLQERAGFMCGVSHVTPLTPYADDRLVQYVFNVPWAMKNMGGQAKGLLREAMADLLPVELLYRRKSPYPKTHDPAYTARVVAAMNDLLDRKGAPLNEILDADAVRGIMEHDLTASGTPWYGQLMSGPQMIAYLLQINDWLETCELSIDL